ncbi:hypothetical protein CJD36_002865 [Flavipsychrobacter stenotrophus]|uniref:DUF3806 domain-containing protein n=2 Tax=Flavipsychrobacter stenotrophus TaxID=2077091 RepID=A0A2S7T0H0_9BACT|nr:hypothetical protein CJD36_002865 [Flavipsychrobacter stenotrophus]
MHSKSLGLFMGKLFFLSSLFSQLSCNNSVPPKYDQLKESDYKKKTDTIDGEVVNSKEAIVKEIDQQITNLNSEQERRVEREMMKAGTLLKEHLKGISINNYTASSLDDLVDLWNNDNSKFNCSQDEFMNTVGFAFGQYLVNTHGMKWKIVNDEYGEDYAIMFENSTLINYPLSSVDKAIREHRVGSLNSISLLDTKAIAELKSGK